MKMTFRDHLLTFQGFRNWPPTWIRKGGKEGVIATGEVGVLRDVKTHDAISSKCFLFIEHDGASFIGRLSCDSPAICQEIVKLLKQHRGELLKFIGGIEVDFKDTEVSVCHAA